MDLNMKHSSLKFSNRNLIFASRNFSDKYEKIKEIGKGSFGRVYRVMQKQTKEYRACKELAKNKIKDRQKFDNEIKIMMKCDHPNIIKLYEIFEDEKHISLIMDECKGGELFDRIIERMENGGKFSGKEAATLFRQLMSAVAYCHEKGICHRDLKPENILLVNEEPDSPIKVIDFGLSRIFGEDEGGKIKEKYNMKTKVGTAYYVSPEVLNGKYDEKCDIWSAGVILYILLCGYPPFNGANDNAIYQKIMNKKYTFPEREWSNISKEAKDLISHMICEPDVRYNAHQVLNHEWVEKNAPNAKAFLDDLNYLNLKRYVNSHKLQKYVANLIVSRIAEKDVEELKKIFESLDVKKNGTISSDDLKSAIMLLKEHGLTIDVEPEIVFQKMNTDGTGLVSYTEFLAATINQKKYFTQERLTEAFNSMDKDGSGKINKRDLIEILGGDIDTEGSLQTYIEMFDLDKDGEISYDEFLKMMDFE